MTDEREATPEVDLRVEAEKRIRCTYSGHGVGPYCGVCFVVWCDLVAELEKGDKT